MKSLFETASQLEDTLVSKSPVLYVVIVGVFGLMLVLVLIYFALREIGGEEFLTHANIMVLCVSACWIIRTFWKLRVSFKEK